MTSEIVERVLGSSRYRTVDPVLVERLAAEELPKARNVDDAVKRVKRRLHQAVGAFRPRATSPTPTAWPTGDAEELRAACRHAMRAHASTLERLPYLDGFYPRIWERTGAPRRLLDLGCGLNPLAVPWMELGDVDYVAVDADAGALRTVAGFLQAIGQPHRIEARDLVRDQPPVDADVALLLKLVTTLDRQDPGAAHRLLRALRVRHAVVSFAARSLGGRGNHARAYRDRMERLVAESGRVSDVAEASVPNELVFVLALDPAPADG